MCDTPIHKVNVPAGNGKADSTRLEREESEFKSIKAQLILQLTYFCN